MASLKIKDGKINFCCKMEKCTHCCCGPFEGISNELCNVDRRRFDEIVLTENDYRAICERGYSHLIEEGFSEVMGKKYYKMALQEDGTCKAWRDGRCSIHDFSPALCQAFPFYFDMFSGLCAIECDGISDDTWTEFSSHEGSIEKAKEMYEYWLKFYSKS